MRAEPKTDTGRVTQALQAVQHGDAAAWKELLDLVQAELRTIAKHHMAKERTPDLMQTTALVNEAYVRIAKDVGEMDFKNRHYFYGAARRVMCRILVEHARARDAKKRGGALRRVPIENWEQVVRQPEDVDFSGLEAALDRLKERDARAANVVHLRFFSELSAAETADVLGLSVRMVQRDWEAARAWLLAELK